MRSQIVLLLTKMSALHWEARRKQAVVDQKAERHKNELEVSESAGKLVEILSAFS